MTDSVVLDSFVNVDAKWQELLRTCTNNHIFLTSQWQKAWWQVFGAGYEQSLLSVYDGSELVGIVPMMLQNGKLSFIGSSDICDYMDFIARQGQEDFVCSRLLDYLESLEWNSIELDALLPQSLTLNYLVPLARQRGYRVEMKQMDVSPQLILPSGWEEYLVLLKTKDRHELRRKLRRLEGTKALNSYSITEIEQLPQALESFFELFKLSDTEKAHFMTDRKREFFKTMGSSLAEKGYIRLAFMEIGETRTSSSLCFDYNNDVYLYNSAYDPAYSSLSVSLLLKVFNIRDAISNGKKRFDFLRGSEPYKYDLGGQDVPVYRCVISRG
jgi:CelD/BcsL family acetyltransferase involved in cellulose biosynthesis